MTRSPAHPSGCLKGDARTHWRCLRKRDRSLELGGYLTSQHQWLFLHPLDSVTTVRRLVAFLRQRTQPGASSFGVSRTDPDEMYFGTGDKVPADLMARAAAA